MIQEAAPELSKAYAEARKKEAEEKMRKKPAGKETPPSEQKEPMSS